MNSKDERDDGKQISVRLDAALHEIVARAAAQEHRSVSGQIRHLVEKGLRQHEVAA